VSICVSNKNTASFSQRNHGVYTGLKYAINNNSIAGHVAQHVRLTAITGHDIHKKKAGFNVNF
jgi:hypothetical protein